MHAQRWPCLQASPRPKRERTGDHQRLQDEGYTVNIDRTGTAPLSQCVVTNVRNPKQVTQWVPYIGPGPTDGDRALVLDSRQPVDLGHAGLQPPLTRICS